MTAYFLVWYYFLGFCYMLRMIRTIFDEEDDEGHWWGEDLHLWGAWEVKLLPSGARCALCDGPYIYLEGLCGSCYQDVYDPV